MKNEILRVKLRCINRLRIFKKITLCNRKQNLILHPGGESPAPHLPASLRLAVQSTAASGLTVICGTGDSCKIRARPRPALPAKKMPQNGAKAYNRNVSKPNQVRLQKCPNGAKACSRGVSKTVRWTQKCPNGAKACSRGVSTPGCDAPPKNRKAPRRRRDPPTPTPRH